MEAFKRNYSDSQIGDLVEWEEESSSGDSNLISHRGDNAVLSIVPSVSERSNSRASRLSALMTFLEGRLVQVRLGQNNRRVIAHETLAILRSILLDAGYSGDYYDIDIFFDKLWGDVVVEASFRSIFSEARTVLTGIGTGTGTIFSNPLKLFSEIEAIISWYALRVTSLEKLEEAGLGSFQEDAIFDLLVLHDRKWAGLNGFEIRSGARIFGRAQQQLWIKAFFTSHAEPVVPKRGWHFWVDETDSIYRVTRDGSRRLCCLAPISPRTNKLIVDNSSLFIPYGAFDLPSGSSEIEIELGLYNVRGRLLCSKSILANVFVSESAGAPSSESRIAPKPSPQAFGVWSSDCVTANSICINKITTGVRDLDGLCGEVISAEIDYDLRGYTGERVSLECRLIRTDGTLVENQSPAFGRVGEPFVLKIELYPQRPIIRESGLALELPITALDLDPGKYTLLFDASFVLPDGQTICGSVEPVSIEVGEEVLEAGFEPPQTKNLPLYDPYSGLLISRLDVMGSFLPEARHRSSIRLSIGCLCPEWERQVFRVIFSLEDKDGEILVTKSKSEIGSATNRTANSKRQNKLMRSVCIGGFSSEHKTVRQELAAHFGSDLVTLAGTASGKGEKERGVVGRVRIYSLDDRLLFDLSREIPKALIETNSAAASAMDSKDQSENNFLPLSISDISTFTLLGQSVAPYLNSDADSKSLKISDTGNLLKAFLRFNFDFRALESARATLFLECLDSVGRPAQCIRIGDNFSSRRLEQLDFSKEISSAIYRNAVFQLEREYELSVDVFQGPASQIAAGVGAGSAFSTPASLGDYSLKAMLFDADGKLLQIAKHPLKVGGAVVLKGPDKEEGVSSTAASKLSQRSWYRRFWKRGLNH